MENKTDNYQIITNQIIALIESGNLKFNSGMIADGSLPYNAKTKRLYSGVNFLTLFGVCQQKQYTVNGWLTFNQVKELGGNVRKGEKGVSIAFFGVSEKESESEAQEDTKRIPFLKRFVVFNVAQCDNLPEEYTQALTNKGDYFHSAEIDRLPELLGVTMQKALDSTPCYAPAVDTIFMPPMTAFTDSANYYATLLHEIVHSTGHKNRLNRDLNTRFGTAAYAAEELIAELGAAFLVHDFGLNGAMVENHAAYMESWLKLLKDDKKAIFTAASAATKAAEYVREVMAHATDKVAA